MGLHHCESGLLLFNKIPDVIWDMNSSLINFKTELISIKSTGYTILVPHDALECLSEWIWLNTLSMPIYSDESEHFIWFVYLLLQLYMAIYVKIKCLHVYISIYNSHCTPWQPMTSHLIQLWLTELADCILGISGGFHQIICPSLGWGEIKLLDQVFQLPIKVL